jgi:hypothetical protein
MELTEDILKTLARAVRMLGEQNVLDTLNGLAQTREDTPEVLTIIGNSGMHPIPADFLHGELYIASQGSLDLSTHDAIQEAFTSVLIRLAAKLSERTWKRIYFVPTGPTTLSLQIKLLVYHITRMSTVDLFYSKGDYFEVDLDYRTYLASTESGK